MPVVVVILIVAAMLWFCLPAVPVILWPLVIGGLTFGAFSVNRTLRRTRRY